MRDINWTVGLTTYRVNPLVHGEMTGVTEGLLTLGTRVGLRLLVLLTVDPQTTSVGKAFVTLCALIRFVPCVNVLVLLQ